MSTRHWPCFIISVGFTKKQPYKRWMWILKMVQPLWRWLLATLPWGDTKDSFPAHVVLPWERRILPNRTFLTSNMKTTPLEHRLSSCFCFELVSMCLLWNVDSLPLGGKQSENENVTKFSMFAWYWTKILKMFYPLNFRSFNSIYSKKYKVSSTQLF